MSLDGQNRSRVLVGTFSMPSGAVFPTHVHDRHQLVWAAEGVVSTAVGERHWVLPPSRALWVPAGVAHATYCSPGEAVLFSVYVDLARCPIAWCEPTPVMASPLLVELIHRLATEGLPDAHRARSEAVLLDVLEPVAVVTVGPPMPVDPRASEVAKGLLTDPADQRTLEQWGQHVGASARTLARAFTAETQLSFGRWRTDARLHAALRMLAEGDAVGRVAERVGYASPSAFVAAFRTATGTTPATYFAGH